MILSWVIFILLVLASLFFIFKKSYFINSIFKARTWGGILVLKFLVGVSAHLIHINYLGGSDANKYFTDAKVVWVETQSSYEAIQFFFDSDSEALAPIYEKVNYWDKTQDKFLIVDNRLVIRFYLLIGPFTQFNFYSALWILNLLYVLSFIILSKALKSFFDYDVKIICLLLLLTPTLIFWNSYLLKEAFVGIFINLLIYAVLKILSKPEDYKYIFLFMLVAIFAFQIKTYILLLMMPGFFYILLKHHDEPLKELTNWLVFMLILVFSGVAMSKIMFNKDFIDILILKQASFIDLINKVYTGSAFEIEKIVDLKSFIKLIPSALINVLVQPQLLSFNRGIYIFPLLENLFLMIAFVFTIKNRTFIKGKRMVLILFLLSFILGLGLLIGMTVPVQGAIARYKTPLIFALILMLFTILDTKKIIEKNLWLQKCLNWL